MTTYAEYCQAARQEGSPEAGVQSCFLLLLLLAGDGVLGGVGGSLLGWAGAATGEAGGEDGRASGPGGPDRGDFPASSFLRSRSGVSSFPKGLAPEK